MPKFTLAQREAIQTLMGGEVDPVAAGLSPMTMKFLRRHGIAERTKFNAHRLSDDWQAAAEKYLAK